jgi:hypothetical protein
MHLRPLLVQIGTCFIHQFSRLRDGRCASGLEFALCHNSAFEEPSNKGAPLIAIARYSARDCAD